MDERANWDRSEEKRFLDITNVSRETLERMKIYSELLQKWQRKINLVSASTLSSVWTRHFLDSAQLSPLISPEGCHLADIGSGAGFPGLVLAIIRSDLNITLIESDVRKIAFLREVAVQTESNVTLLSKRVEDIQGRTFDYITARACAPLHKLLDWSDPLLKKGGIALFMKGENAPEELTDARKQWMIEMQAIESLTHPKATILKINGFKRVGD